MPENTATKKYLELCVNTGEFQRSLGEIEITNVKNDHELFKLVRRKYEELRAYRVKFFLLKAVDVHFVQVNQIEPDCIPFFLVFLLHSLSAN